MARRTQPSEDDWRNVEDTKKRKQIQDRLAQRARRKLYLCLSSHASIFRPTQQTACRQRKNCISSSSHEDSSCPIPPKATIGDCLSLAPSKPQSFYTPLINQPNFPLTLGGAIWINGQVLGLSCGTVVPAKSKPPRPDVPLSLQPTELQLMTIHTIWIDRLPFPKMRDSMISLSGVVDDEEVLGDLWLMPSFEIVPGRPPWDPEAWKILKPFAEKWGFLFYR
ncbi:hypothetical protein P280DRAFT_459300 [Massarina eburnea CBS 473.64]|uniref:BZIP domain-containing protein n=1 Tax=Massarina eburnea CBS 473.64 TaxID=1395130 RepID=A0A6A6RQN6_9PLEO|nr:hypothetical protein P280DRAFT_459300 [Massarina eburnea CBS 473.64]